MKNRTFEILQFLVFIAIAVPLAQFVMGYKYILFVASIGAYGLLNYAHATFKDQ